MPETLIPATILQKPGRILFITHLAIGDYTYLQNFFKTIATAYPHLELYVWVDELRRTANPGKWASLKKYSLYDWLAACPFFKKIYNQTYSPELYKKSIAEARAQNYAAVISICSLRPHKYAKLAREISPDGFVTGLKKKSGGLFGLFRNHAYKKLDAIVPPRGPLPGVPKSRPDGIRHVTDDYAAWFFSLFGIVPEPRARLPYLEIPETWRHYANHYLQDWKITQPGTKIVFINITAKINKRCWPLAHAIELIRQMQQFPAWREAAFLLNAMPGDYKATQQHIDTLALPHVRVFSANDNFFQLPAILSLCSLVISVETAVMHLANAVHVPVIAMMRKKTPEWVPLDLDNSIVITAKKLSDWIKDISVSEVLAALDKLPAIAPDAAPRL